MDEQKKQLVAKLKDSQNVLVTVSKDPSVDQLAAAIGLTLALNKLDKHATAVYSGATPSTLEFLKPEETLETNTDSLRDFIIALDKSKADKLRYKVEDQVVRIFITPYKTSISEQDLDFSQGDFNVDIVVALGVSSQQDIDQAIQAHGRILHDAVVSSIAVEGQPELGTLNVIDTNASSLSEVVTELIQNLDGQILDGQIATALLTGIVATTDRFSNEHTSPETMNASAKLMSAGANQQLIATELETPPEPEAPAPEPEVDQDEQVSDPGTLEISHSTSDDTDDSESEDEDTEVDAPPVEEPPQIQVDADGKLVPGNDQILPKIGEVHGTPNDTEEPEHEPPLVTRQRMVEPPTWNEPLTANTEEEGLDAPAEELVRPVDDSMPMLSHETGLPDQVTQTESPEPVAPAQVDPVPVVAPQPMPEPELTVQEPVPAETPQTATPFVSENSQAPAPIVLPDQAEDNYEVSIDDDETLADIERAVHSPHADALPEQVAPSVVQDADASLEDARNAVEAALNAAPQTTPDPIVALNAQPLGPELHEAETKQQTPFQPAPGFGQTPAQLPVDDATPDMTLDMPLPGVPQNPAPASAFPGALPPSPQDTALPPPPPVPPPPIIPA